MTESYDSERLTEEVLNGLREHAAFEDAARALAGQEVSSYLGNPTLRRFNKDRGTTLVVLFAVCLHFSDEGLTLASLKALCRKSKACSFGRAIAMVSDMRARGDIVPADGQSRGRTRKLAVGEKFLTYHRERLREQLQALSRVSPIGAEALARLDEPGYFGAVMRVTGAILAHSADLITEDTPIINFFAEHDAGMMIVLDIVAREDGALAQKPVKISVSAISNRFMVSRVHILKLLREADTAGLMRWDADARLLTLSPSLATSLARYCAAILMVVAYCCAMAAQSNAPGRLPIA